MINFFRKKDKEEEESYKSNAAVLVWIRLNLALKYNKPKPKNHGQNHLIPLQIKFKTHLVADLSKNMALPAYSQYHLE
jgi:hypothetical protein